MINRVDMWFQFNFFDSREDLQNVMSYVIWWTMKSVLEKLFPNPYWSNNINVKKWPKKLPYTKPYSTNMSSNCLVFSKIQTLSILFWNFADEDRSWSYINVAKPSLNPKPDISWTKFYWVSSTCTRIRSSIVISNLEIFFSMMIWRYVISLYFLLDFTKVHKIAVRTYY